MEVTNFEYIKYPEVKVPYMHCIIKNGNQQIGSIEYKKFNGVLEVILGTFKLKEVIGLEVIKDFFTSISFHSKNSYNFTYSNKIKITFEEFQSLSRTIIEALEETIEDNH